MSHAVAKQAPAHMHGHTHGMDQGDGRERKGTGSAAAPAVARHTCADGGPVDQRDGRYRQLANG